MDEITEMQNKWRDLDKQICQLGLDKLKLWNEIIEKMYGIKIGSEVICVGKRYRVIHIETKSWDVFHKPWILGEQMKKDGTYGERRKQLYNNWEKVL